MKARRQLAIWALAAAMASGVPGCGLGKPELPVAISTRPAILSNSLVVQVKNLSDKHLVVVVRITSPSTKQTKVVNASLHPRELEELGLIQGIMAASGDRVEVRHADYRPVSYRVP